MFSKLLVCLIRNYDSTMNVQASFSFSQNIHFKQRATLNSVALSFRMKKPLTICFVSAQHREKF